MNKYVHRIFKSSTASSITRHHVPISDTAVGKLVQEVQDAKLLYFGEFHSESRIISFQTELVKEWSKRLAKGSKSSKFVTPPKIHLIMEHFSVDMQDLLDRYQGRHANGSDETYFSNDENEAFKQFVQRYKDDYGTEGHDLVPYCELLQFCRQTAINGSACDENDQSYCEVVLHGGFIPRNHAARLNKECPDDQSKRLFFEEMSNLRKYLPQEGDAMYNALFETSITSNSLNSRDSFTLKGSSKHRLLIQSLMDGTDLYSAPFREEDLQNSPDEATPMARLYQAQLLKDHSMGYRIAKIMLDHHIVPNASDSSCMQQMCTDRYLVIAGFGHLKHHLGVPECVVSYLREEAIYHPDACRRAAAMDLLINVSSSISPITTRTNVMGRGSALIGCQMMYEAYVEDSYPLLQQEIKKALDEDADADVDMIKRKFLKDLYLNNPALLDECILKSNEISGPFLRFSEGIGGFGQPCADYLFVYDEDDENIISDSDRNEISSIVDQCTFQRSSENSSAEDSDAKKETREAYERVGKTAGIKGNSERARAIMRQLGYSEIDLSYLGDDYIYNFQGVANPHNVAKIRFGETVLDIGSGLGIDSFLAMRDSGASRQNDKESISNAFVIGVDLAESEVNHATERAIEKGYNVPERLRFIRGDVEELFSNNIILQGTFDVCISNGAFCLVPDKKKAFYNVYKALRSGGRCAISTTTIISDSLDPSFDWPVCMRMFARLDSLQPMLESIGFTNVKIINAESLMEGLELPEECQKVDSRRFKIHGKYADQYGFLQNIDMDNLCKVVTIYGEKT